jgi:hypothetical protein
MNKKDIAKRDREIKRLLKRQKRMAKAAIQPVSPMAARLLLKWRFVMHMAKWLVSFKTIRICDTVGLGAGYILSVMAELPNAA